MNKELDKIINPPWMASIRKMERQASIISKALESSKVLEGAIKSSKIHTILKYQRDELGIINNAKKIANVSKLALTAFEKADAFKSILDMKKSYTFETIAHHHFESLKVAKKLLQNIQIPSTVFNQINVNSPLLEISKISSFYALAQLKNSPFPALSINDYATIIDNSEFIDNSILDINNTINIQVESVKDFNDLPEKTKRILSYLYHNYFLPLLLSMLVYNMTLNANETREKLQKATNPIEVKKVINTTNNKYLLNGYRVTTATNLYIRESETTKSNIVSTLPFGSLVEILDKSNRSWLLIEAEIRGELVQGWVFRRYTQKIK